MHLRDHTNTKEIGYICVSVHSAIFIKAYNLRRSVLHGKICQPEKQLQICIGILKDGGGKQKF